MWKRADTGTPPNNALDQQRVMYYNANWQLLEEFINDDWSTQSPDDEHDRRMMYTWGTRYIDDIVARQQAEPLEQQGPGPVTDTWYHLTDTLFSTVAIIDENAKLVERVSYDGSYSGAGNTRHHRMADLTGDGATGNPDNNLLIGNWGDYGVGDLNRDGIVDQADLDLLRDDRDPAQPAGRISTPASAGGTDNIVGYAGYIFNAEIHGGGLYTVRHRHYAPELGRWLSRDPIGYVDGMSLYEYVSGQPSTRADFTGLFQVVPDGLDLEDIIDEILQEKEKLEQIQDGVDIVEDIRDALEGDENAAGRLLERGLDQIVAPLARRTGLPISVLKRLIKESAALGNAIGEAIVDNLLDADCIARCQACARALEGGDQRRRVFPSDEDAPVGEDTPLCAIVDGQLRATCWVDTDASPLQRCYGAPRKELRFVPCTRWGRYGNRGRLTF